MSNSAGWSKNLKVQWIRQDAEKLPDLLADAEFAQQMLKEKFCPNAPWGKKKLNDTSSCQLTDPQRTWVGSVDSLAGNGSH